MSAQPGLIRLGGKPTIGAYLRKIWARREFATSVPLGELRAQNMDTVAGGAWNLLNPLFLIGVYYLIFDVLLDVSRGVENYITFLAIGVFTYFFTQKSLMQGAQSIVKNTGLIRSIKFPRAILPLSSVIGEFAALGPAVVCMLALAIITGEDLHLGWFWLVPIFALQFLFNLGLALFAARLTHHFRDVQQLLPYLLRLGFYMSGVLFSVDIAVRNPTYKAVFAANPAYEFITLARMAVFTGTTSPQMWLYASGWTAATLVGGMFFFLAREQLYGRE